MSILNRILILLLATELLLVSIQHSYALYSDSASSTGNVFTAALEFSGPSGASGPSGPSGIANHLVINEVYYDVDSSHLFESENDSEWVEIYNPTQTEVNLNGWTLEDFGGDSESLGGPFPPGNFLILIATDAVSFQTKWTLPIGTILIEAGGQIGGMLANSGDSLILRNSGTEVDRMSWGTNTTGFISGCTGNCPSVGDGHSLERSPDGFDTDSAGDFIDNSPPLPGS